LGPQFQAGLGLAARTSQKGPDSSMASFLQTGLRVLLVAVCGAIPPGVSADVYRYVDDAGVIHFTNHPVDDRFEPIRVAPAGFRRGGRAPRVARYDSLISRLGREHSVEPALVKAVIAAESNFDPKAVSRKGAQGLMQLMPGTARLLGVEDAFEPEQNVSGGTRYLREMLTRYGDMTRALAAYNAGPEAVDRYRGVPPYPETQDYVDRVLTYYVAYGNTLSR